MNTKIKTAILLILANTLALAAPIGWDGELNADFHEPQNWRGDLTPTALDSADISGALGNGAAVIASADIAVDNLRIGTESGDGSLTIINQSVNIAGNLEIADLDWSTNHDVNGNFSMTGDGTQQLTVGGGLRMGHFYDGVDKLMAGDVTATFAVANIDSVVINAETDLHSDRIDARGSHNIDFSINNVRNVRTENIDLDYGRGPGSTFTADLSFSNIDTLQVRDIAWESISPHENFRINLQIDTVPDAKIRQLLPDHLSFRGSEHHTSQSSIDFIDSTITVDGRYGATTSGKSVQLRDTAEIQSTRSLNLTNTDLTFNSNTFTMAVIGGGGTNPTSTYDGSVSLLDSVLRHDGTMRFGNHYDNTAGSFTADWSMVNSVMTVANEFTFGEVSGVGTLDATFSMNPSYLQVGDLTLGDAAHLILTLEGTTRATEAGVLGGAPNLYSAIDILGTGNLDGILEIQLGGGFNPVIGDTFTLINAGMFTGGFDAFRFPMGSSWTFTQNANNILASYAGNAVPEPSTIIMFLFLLAGPVLYSRKRSIC